MKTLFESLMKGVALTPTNVNTAKIVGPAIVNPWHYGESLMATFIASAFSPSDSITIGVDRRRAGTALWDTVLDNAGDPLTFDAEADGGALENGLIHGELNLNAIVGTKADAADLAARDPHTGGGGVPGTAHDYDAIRFTAINANTSNVLIGGTYVIGNLRVRPSNDASAEGLWAKQRVNQPI